MKRLFALLFLATLLPCSAAETAGELRLTHHSTVDDTDQPYRLFVPKVYDGKTALPLVIALHGTGGNEGTIFESYGSGRIKEAAEKHGVFVLSPFARGVTEYRGIGEQDVFAVLAEVRKNYRIDEERLYVTGHSMGGTGAAYLALHHPDIFAAAAPLAAAYSFPWLAPNGRQTPFWWILGGKDYPPYLVGVRAGAERMMKLGEPTKIEILPGKGHGDWVADSFDRVFAWFLEHRRAPAPREYEFVADTPLHGLAYSTAIDAIAKPGLMASVKVHIGADGAIGVQAANVSALAVLPEAPLVDLAKPLAIQVNGDEVFRGVVGAAEEVQCRQSEGRWQAALAPRRSRDLAQWRTHPVGTAPDTISVNGVESAVCNWAADAMREATGADVALINRRYYRGLGIAPGTVDIVDVIQAIRPFDQYLVTAQLTGAEIIQIIEANIGEPVTNIIEDRVVQVSGLKYAFDRRRAEKQRVVSCSLDPKRTYTVALEGQVPERETMYLAGQFGTLKYRITEFPFSTALYAHAVRQKQIVAPPEGRVREIAAP